WPPLDQFYNENLAPAIADRFSLTGDEAVYGPAYVNRMDETKRRYSGAGKQTKDNNDIWGVSLTVDYSLGALDFKSISAYREVSFEVASDPDHTPFDIVDRNVEEDSEQLSQEFQLSGDVLDDKLSFIMGLYALQEKGKNRAFVPILTGIENILGDIISQDFDGSIKSSSYAVFGEATWNFSEQFAVTVGGRLNYDKKRYKFSLRRYFSQELLVGPFDLEESWTKFLPKVGLEFNPSDDIMAFATFSQGYKAGGWNPRAQPGDTDPNSFDPEDLTSYEFGLKTSLLDNRLILNTAAFYSDYKEIQLSAVTVRPDGSPETRVVNGGKARIYGFEAELNARPTPDLTLVAGFGYLDAKYKQLDADVMAVGIGIDNKLPQIPRITFNAQANYTIDLPRRARFVLSGDTTYKSKIHRSVQNFPELLTPSYWLFNSRLTFLDASDRYELAAFVTNITNKMYLTSGVDVRALGFVESYYSRPREWGLSVKVKF
ncbi:MAG: TonB-dependent receptor, partial [Syntrophorhabdaceae bacterium]